MKQVYTVIGLMSGTSVDGLDIVACRFELKGPRWKYSILGTEEVPYPEHLKDSLIEVVRLQSGKIAELDTELGRWYGQCVHAFLSGSNLKVDFIASHGHTVFHEPDKGLTKQIGSAIEIYNATGIPVVNDFRSKDVSLEGQGAPLVPLGDQMLFEDHDFCLNLGGIANMSFDVNGERYAYDICECNIVLNSIARKLGSEYDKGGEMASKGTLDSILFDELESLTYYKEPFPKSLGIEWIHKEVMPLIDKNRNNDVNQLYTCTTHIAHRIASDILNMRKKMGLHKASLLITGGGVFNEFLIHFLKGMLGDTIRIEIPDERIIRFKEALIFAFLGVRRVREEVNCLSSVTGAQNDNVGGEMYGFD